MLSVYSVVNANRALWLLAAFACIAGCGPKNDASTEILVFAAASLADVMTEVEEAFERQSDVKVDISYGGSQLLAQQIASGAPADIFVSAGRFPVDFLKERGLLEPGWSSLLTNKLVVTSPTSGGAGVTSLAELAAPEVRRIAIANPKLAPAGRYAQESLTQLGLWDRLQPKLVFASDVRATLAFVEAGNADAAIVYVTDARLARNVTISDVVPQDSYSRIGYPVAVVARSRGKAAALDFVAFLRGDEAGQIFAEHGFEPAQ